MSKPVIRSFLGTLAVVAVMGTVQLSMADEAPAPDRTVSMDSVPAEALQAARSAKPNVFFQSAEATYWNDERVYILTGTQISRIWRVYVTRTGIVKELVSEDRRGD